MEFLSVHDNITVCGINLASNGSGFAVILNTKVTATNLEVNLVLLTSTEHGYRDKSSKCTGLALWRTRTHKNKSLIYTTISFIDILNKNDQKKPKLSEMGYLHKIFVLASRILAFIVLL